MHEYSNVEVISLDDKQSNDQKGNTNDISIQKDSEKSYSILVKGGEKTFFFSLLIKTKSNFFSFLL